MSNNLLPQAFPVSTQASMQMSHRMNIPPPELISKPEVKLSQPISGYQESPALPLRSGSMSVNMDTTSVLGKRKSPVQPVFSGTAPPQMLPVQNKRMVRLEHGSCVSELNKGPVLMKQSSSVSRGTQYLPASFCKNAPASGKQTAARKQITQKPHNEYFESVRSKMRESLAGALAMVQCQMEAPKESKRLHCETAANPLQGHVSEPVSAASGVDAMVSNGILTDPVSVQTVLPEILTITRESDVKEVLVQKPFLHDSFSYSDIVFSEDDLLQGNDLSWALESDIAFTDGCQNEMIGAVANDGSQERSKEKILLDPQVLAFKVEAELFRLFCGVNKKYKEKGRSLLFNLKDRNNPKLREKVMFGEIPAERLCSMSAEELASKELAEWRQAKAEEMAQMVVLQDTQVDIRNLVRKTHKGEFQVEVEPIDRGSVEVSVGMSSLNWSRPKNIKKKPPSITKPLGIKNELNDSNEGTGLINGVTIDDEMQAATGSLPAIVSLDEFMLSVDSESPSDSSSSDIVKRPNVSDNAEAVIILTSPKESANIDIGTSPVNAEATPVKVDASPVKVENGDIVSLKPCSDLKSEMTSDFIPVGERVWEGALQLSASSVSSVIGILRSGEKTTTKEWPMLLDIKGRVRLDAFEKFVRELPNSRSRAVMVMCFVCKEECSKTEQENISEVVDTYSRDERVGYAEPASGVELYLCPTRGRTAEILNKIVPRNQLDLLKSLDDGLIGLVVWRRPQLKNQQVSNFHKNHREISSLTTHNTSRYSNMVQVSHDDGGDVPPGFGPMAIAQDDDDLPEFNYCSGRNVVMNRTESVRELIHKYGKSEPLWNQQGFNDADNEILPEWQPKLIHQSVVSNNVNGGPMVRPRSDWWPHQAGGRY